MRVRRMPLGTALIQLSRVDEISCMHELSIAIDLIDAATAELERLGSPRVIAVHLKLGRLSGVVKEALAFSFDAAAEGTKLEGARLQIEDVPVAVWCDGCDAERDLPDLARRRCPVCQSRAPQMIRGDELQLLGLEIENT
jgi:hydrogenase nickel incorporation protein HypA/HybF